MPNFWWLLPLVTGISSTPRRWRTCSACTGLTSVVIPDSVTEIGECAFASCKGLTSVSIPDSVKKIGEYAFAECTGLTSVSIPDSVKSLIPKNAFVRKIY